jgi:glucose-6-phosphate-specific signal transduction histidine kinase
LSEELQERVVFSQPAIQESISDPVRMAVVAVREELNQTSNKANNIVVVGRRSVSSELELSISDDGIGNDTRQTLGALGTAMVQPESKIFGSTLVLQAGPSASTDNY